MQDLPPRCDYEAKIVELTAQLESALSRSVSLEGRNQLLEQFVGVQAQHSAGGSAVHHASVWWLDDVTRRMIDQRLSLDGVLTFTLRGDSPITLTRDQVRQAKT